MTACETKRLTGALELFHIDPVKRQEFEDYILSANQREDPEESAEVKALSKENEVYIYNIGPFRFIQEMGSYGKFVIPASVDGAPTEPIVIPGLPSEYYWSGVTEDGIKKGRLIYHKPFGSPYSPGVDFAMEVIGAGQFSSSANNLMQYGVFVSEGYPPLAKEKWNALRWLKETAKRKCDQANYTFAISRDRFLEYRSDALYDYARILGKTEIQCPWLGDNGKGSL